MPGETTENNAPNTQITNNEEGNKVHYHLSANVKFDKTYFDIYIYFDKIKKNLGKHNE